VRLVLGWSRLFRKRKEAWWRRWRPAGTGGRDRVAAVAAGTGLRDFACGGDFVATSSWRPESWQRALDGRGTWSSNCVGIPARCRGRETYERDTPFWPRRAALASSVARAPALRVRFVHVSPRSGLSAAQAPQPLSTRRSFAAETAIRCEAAADYTIVRPSLPRRRKGGFGRALGISCHGRYCGALSYVPARTPPAGSARPARPRRRGHRANRAPSASSPGIGPYREAGSSAASGCAARWRNSLRPLQRRT
jgi:hypothetical protein